MWSVKSCEKYQDHIMRHGANGFLGRRSKAFLPRRIFWVEKWNICSEPCIVLATEEFLVNFVCACSGSDPFIFFCRPDFIFLYRPDLSKRLVCLDVFIKLYKMIFVFLVFFLCWLVFCLGRTFFKTPDNQNCTGWVNLKIEISCHMIFKKIFRVSLRWMM